MFINNHELAFCAEKISKFLIRWVVLLLLLLLSGIWTKGEKRVFMSFWASVVCFQEAGGQ